MNLCRFRRTQVDYHCGLCACACQLNEDASHVLTLNERLTRYALYVSQLERSNNDMTMQIETLHGQVADAKNDHAETQARSASKLCTVHHPCVSHGLADCPAERVG